LVATCKLSVSYDDPLHDDGSVQRETVAEGALESTERDSEVSLHQSTVSWVDQQHLHRHGMGPASERFPETAHDGLDSMPDHVEPNSEADE
jgi:hypothetical protein